MTRTITAYDESRQQYASSVTGPSETGVYRRSASSVQPFDGIESFRPSAGNLRNSPSRIGGYESSEAGDSDAARPVSRWAFGSRFSYARAENSNGTLILHNIVRQRPIHWGRNVLYNHDSCIFWNSAATFSASVASFFGAFGVLKLIGQVHTANGIGAAVAGVLGAVVGLPSMGVSGRMLLRGDEEVYERLNLVASIASGIGNALVAGAAIYSNDDNCDFGHDCLVGKIVIAGLVFSGVSAPVAVLLTLPLGYGARSYHITSFLTTLLAGAGSYLGGVPAAFSLLSDCNQTPDRRDNLACAGSVAGFIGLIVGGVAVTSAAWGLGRTAQRRLTPSETVPVAAGRGSLIERWDALRRYCAGSAR